MTNTLANRLKKALQRGGGYSSVAKAAGISQTSLNNYLSGKGEMKVSIASKLAKACNISLEWLIDGVGNMEAGSSPSISSKEVISIPIYDVTISADHGVEPISQDVKDLVVLPKKLLLDYSSINWKHVIAVTVSGDSMFPTLHDGDTILVQTDIDELVSGAIYVVRVENELLVKRLRRLVNGNIQVISDNTLYPPEELNAKQLQAMIEGGGSPVQIIGKVIWRSGHMGN
ncbi:LexA family transcriptional regulator [Entomobacter blattae]|uniref:HTH-type transcriptional regulator PrtR n=1 Tax=Entomobacter blattae TaxID=2762277 RepID=A0A7H1NQ78_9PROT|nr:S24 family peptidase [Entomobacter blattae]QNT77938.1 HTH-type transcriptional regulator PrtR [Entomobacter blattae]